MHRKTTRRVLAAAACVAIGVPSVAFATGEGNPLRLGKRNPSSSGSQTVNRETEIIGSASTYTTRQSNKRIGDGGGAIYGCRSDGGTEACLSAQNLRTGRAFDFRTTGKVGGTITVTDPTAAPLATNATGVATGFNADKLDGQDGASLAKAADLEFAAVKAADGALLAKRGAVASARTSAANGTYAVSFDRDVSACSFTVGAQGATANGAVAFATSPAAGDPKTVVVDQADDEADRADFHLQVVC